MNGELLQIFDRLGGIEANQKTTTEIVQRVEAKLAGSDGQPGLCTRVTLLERWQKHITKKFYGQSQRFWAVVGAIFIGVSIRLLWSWYQ